MAGLADFLNTGNLFLPKKKEYSILDYNQTLNQPGNTWGVNQPIPTATPQVTQSQPQSNNTMSLREQMQKGLIPWDDNKLNSGGNGGGGGVDDLTRQLQAQADEFGNAANSALDLTAKRLQEIEYPQAQTDVENEFNRGKTSIENQLTQQDQLTAKDTGAVNDSYHSAYDDAVRAYNALSQRSGAQFGRGNSAGQAVGEIAMQEFFRSQGQLGSALQKNIGEIQYRDAAIRTGAKNDLDELEKMRTQQMQSLASQLKGSLLQVDQQRLEVGQSKAQLKIQLLQQAINTAQAISMQETTFKQNIQIAVTDALLNNEATYKDTLAKYNIDTSQLPYQSIVQNSNAYAPFVSTTQNNQTTKYINPLSLKTKDEFSVTNPFFA